MVFKSDRQRKGFFARVTGRARQAGIVIKEAREKHRVNEQQERQQEIVDLQRRLERERIQISQKQTLANLKAEERKTREQLAKFTTRGRIAAFIRSPETKARLKKLRKIKLV